MNKPQTIADLGQSQIIVDKAVTVGKSMIGDERRPLEQRIKDLEERRRLENEVLEAGGYDYNGTEAWKEAMRNVGRM